MCAPPCFLSYSMVRCDMPVWEGPVVCADSIAKWQIVNEACALLG